MGIDLGHPPGTMMPVGPHHLVTFFGRLRLVSLYTGKVVHEWAEIDTGETIASSFVGARPYPVLALDPARARFAVGTAGGIEVVTFDVARLPPA